MVARGWEVAIDHDGGAQTIVGPGFATALAIWYGMIFLKYLICEYYYHQLSKNHVIF